MKRRAFLRLPFSRHLVPAALLLGALGIPSVGFAAAFVWTGGSGSLWTTPASWQGGSAPPLNSLADSDLFFGNLGAGPLSSNLGASFSIRTLTFSSDASAFVFDSGALTLGAGGIIQNSANAQSFSTTPVLLGVDQTWVLASGAGALVFGSGLNTSGGPGNAPHALTVAAATTTGNGNVIGGVISGGGSLTKIDAGILTLTGDSTYAGSTTISAGTLQIGDGGTTGSLGAGSVINNGTLVFNRSNFAAVTNAISGTGGLIKNGAGTITLSGASTYTGATTVNAGTLNLNGATLTNTAGITVNAGGTLGISGGARITTAGGFILAGFAGDGSTATASLAGGSSALTVAGASVGINGNAAFMHSGGTFTASFLSIAANPGSSGSYLMSGGTLNTGSLTVGSLGVGTFTQTGGAVNVTGALSLGFQIGSTGVYNFNGGTIQAGRVDGRNGTFNFNGGVLQAREDNFLGNAFMGGLTAVTFGASGGGIDSAGHNILITQNLLDAPGLAATPQLGLVKFGAGTLTLTGANSYTGPTYIVGGVLQVGDGGTTGTLGSGDTVNATSLVVNRSNALSYAGAISGTGSVTKLGAGTLTLSGNNTFTGGLTIGGGVVSVGSDASLGEANGVVTLQNGGRLVLTNAITTSRTFHLNNTTLNLNGSTLNGASIDGGFLAGSATLSGASLFNLSTLPGSVLGVGASGATLDNVTVRGRLNVLSPSSTVSFTNGLVTSAGAVTVGSGTPSTPAVLNTSGAEIQGLLTINGGGTVANAGPSLVFGGGARTTINAGGTLSAASGSSIELNGALLVNNGTQSGALNVNFGSRAQGAGTFGAVTVTSGGVFSPGNSPGTANVQSLSLDAGGRYQFELNSAVAANASPGKGADLINVAGLFTITAGTTPNARFTVAIASLDGGNSPAALADFDPSQSYRFTLVSAAGGITGFDAAAFTVDTSAFLNGLGGGVFSVVQDGNSLYLQFLPVPEPSTWALVPVGALAGAMLRWRARQRI